jgi:Ala-tRNA(Pro) deacylase
VAKVVMIKMGTNSPGGAAASRRLDMDAFRSRCKADSSPPGAGTEFEKIFPDCDLGAERLRQSLQSGHRGSVIERGPANRFNAGTHREMIQIAWKDFAQLVHPTVAPITFEA